MKGRRGRNDHEDNDDDEDDDDEDNDVHTSLKQFLASYDDRADD